MSNKDYSKFFALKRRTKARLYFYHEVITFIFQFLHGDLCQLKKKGDRPKNIKCTSRISAIAVC